MKELRFDDLYSAEYYKDVSLRMKNKELDMRFTGLSWTLPEFER